MLRATPLHVERLRRRSGLSTPFVPSATSLRAARPVHEADARSRRQTMRQTSITRGPALLKFGRRRLLAAALGACATYRPPSLHAQRLPTATGPMTKEERDRMT